jgi:hypothetical protein
MDFADYFWLGLLVLFVLVEIPSAIWKREWTLSHHVWEWFGFGRHWKEDYAGIRWIILAGLLVNTTLHFLLYTSVFPVIVFAAGAAWSIWYHYRHEAKT